MATIVMESAKVIEACETTIAHIEAERIARDEQAIKNTMMQTRIGAWFKRYNPTREQAIKILDNDRGHFFGWRSAYAWDDLSHAKDLLRLAKRGDPVTLNEKDCRVIF